VVGVFIVEFKFELLFLFDTYRLYGAIFHENHSNVLGSRLSALGSRLLVDRLGRIASASFLVAVSLFTLEVEAGAQTADYLVDADAPLGGTGVAALGWGNAFQTLEQAVQQIHSTPGFDKIILVAEGSYSPGLSADTLVPGGLLSNPRHHSYVIREPMKIYGGFKGFDTGGTHGTTIPNNPDGAGINTILEGDIGLIGNRGDNLLHIMYIDGTTGFGDPFQTSEVVLRNLHIQGGVANDPSFGVNQEGMNGGGIYVHDAVLSIDRHIWMDNNFAGNNGGAICTRDAALRMGRGRIKHNFAGNNGGGIYLDNTPIPAAGADGWKRLSHLYNLDIRDNYAAEYGGGLYLAASHPGSEGGDGIIHSGFVFANCLVLYNKAKVGAGIFLAYDDYESLWINNTIAENSAGITSGGFYAEKGATFKIANSIIFDNVGNGNPDNLGYEGPLAPIYTTSKVVQSDIGDSQFVLGFNGGFVWCNMPVYKDTVFNYVPNFRNAALGDFRLNQSSVCLDMGDDRHLPFDYMDIDDQGGATQFQILPLDIARILNGQLASWRENQIPGPAPGLPSSLVCGPVALTGVDALAPGSPVTGGRLLNICDLGCYENTWVLVPQ
jgi:hypothetical protein